MLVLIVMRCRYGSRMNGWTIGNDVATMLTELSAVTAATTWPTRMSVCCERFRRGRMDPLVLAAGTALIGAMATDAWQEARAAAVAWWRKAHPGQAGAVGAELDTARAQVLSARGRGDSDTEQALAGTWRLRLQQLLDQDPASGPALRRLLEDLTRALPEAGQARVQQIIINAQAGDQARQYIAGRDQHITGS